ncbi:RNA polymerase sigma factor [Paenibacillus sp. N4]|uniref:RNA polymerase sigma factor n=1 Tax=Paenibacillus vietnamensis TaxID=2590547 RepID=UPI001CD0671C|nr:RNA polymerase sigma factor [Paenibacillus vietnamensis]MCA0757173.1 RNA polymerase sigma factor [Paenibacillus vietnamensis]
MEENYLNTAISLGAPEIEELVHRYWHEIWQYAFFLTRHEQLAEDIAQDTFVQAFRSISSFRGECSVKTWLFKIARNTAFNYRKSAFFRKVTLFGLLKDKTASFSAEAHYFNNMLTDEIWEAVLALPKRYREIIILHAHYGLTHAELVDLLGISAGTIKSRLHRARAMLKQMMEEAETNVETNARE